MQPHNPNPNYQLKHGLPPVLSEIYDVFASELTTLHRNLQIETRKSGARYRRFKEPRLKACGALMMALLAHVNLASGMVYSTASDMAYACGLVTKGKKGIPSIARCTRALYELHRIGLIEYEKGNFNTVEGIRDPLFIRIMPRFWAMFGQEAAYMVRKQQNALAALKRKMTGQTFGVDASLNWEQESLAIAKILYSDLCHRNRLRNSRAAQLAKARQKARRAKYMQEKAALRAERRSRHPATSHEYRRPNQYELTQILNFEDPGITSDPAFLDYLEAFGAPDKPPH